MGTDRWAPLRAEARAALHLEGPLPPGTTELLFLPTFHEALGVRLTGASVELWKKDDVHAVTLDAAAAPRVAALLTRCALEPVPERGGGRDGLVLFSRTHLSPVEFFSSTTGGDETDPWLRLGRELLRSLSARDSAIDALLTYFPSRP